MVIFIQLVQYAKNLGGKSRKNLVEHQIIKMIRKFNSIICRFLHPIVKITHSVSYMYGVRKNDKSQDSNQPTQLQR